MSDDHERKFDRRQALAAFGAVSLSGVLAACGGDDDGGSGTTAVTTEDGTTATVAPKTGSSASGLFDDSASCSVTPQETEGPYYFDVDSIRSDIREDRDGTPLRLAIRVRSAGGDCAPIENAVVDIWHCDALGLYSGFESASQGGPGGGRTDDETYLRGAQVTNKDGIVEFRTIYPGFYRGRTTHIHAKVHVDRQTVLTSQLYFDDDLTAKVYAGEPYSKAGERDTFNDSDGIFDQRLVTTTKRDGNGYLALMTFDVQQA